MKSNNSIMHFIALVVLVIIIGVFFVFSLLNRQTSPWGPVLPNRQSPIPELWVRQGIYIEPDYQSLLMAVEDKLIFIGSNAPDNDPFHVIAIDKNTGSIIWQYGNGNETSLAASVPLVFVGGVGEVTALDLDNGKIVWSTNLPFTRSVTKLLVQDNILYVDTVSENHFLLETETGKILQTISYSESENVPTWSDHKMNLEFAGNIMYFQKQTGLPSGEVDIIAIDKLTGNQLWSSGVPAATRIAANSFGVYVLTLEGKLLRFDPANGSSSELMQFTPPPIQNYYSERGTAWKLGYYVAADTNNQLIFVYFEDSAQLFAYRLPISP